MKPGDHPDFFRFPAPPGRSRESTIRLDRNGRFWHDDERVEHEGMAAAFASWIDVHPDDGRFILTNGYDWTYFTVEDAPFVIRSVRLEVDRVGAATEVIGRLSDGSEEPLDPATFAVGEQDALYCRVKAGKLDARFTPGAQTALGPLLVEGDGGAPEIELGGERFPVGAR